MTLSSLRIALQGLGAPYPLSPVAVAVQGLLGGEAVAPAQPEIPRAAIVGRGPGTTLNYSEYLRLHKRPVRVLPAVQTHASPAQRRARQRRQRQLVTALLLADF